MNRRRWKQAVVIDNPQEFKDFLKSKLDINLYLDNMEVYPNDIDKQCTKFIRECRKSFNDWINEEDIQNYQSFIDKNIEEYMEMYIKHVKMAIFNKEQFGLTERDELIRTINLSNKKLRMEKFFVFEIIRCFYYDISTNKLKHLFNDKEIEDIVKQWEMLWTMFIYQYMFYKNFNCEYNEKLNIRDMEGVEKTVRFKDLMKDLIEDYQQIRWHDLYNYLDKMNNILWLIIQGKEVNTNE